YLASPVRPILSSVPAEPSTPAYNLLSAIATRTPGTTDSESEGRRLAPSESRTRPTSDSRRLASTSPGTDSHPPTRKPDSPPDKTPAPQIAQHNDKTPPASQ
ncbi:hypothetical protein FRC11_003048, partial [Ceratobasidium sp. 423]